MPQVHNPSRLMDMDSSAFGKNSRFMTTTNFTAASVRRMNALNFLDKRLTDIKIKYHNRQERIQIRKLERTRNRMLENLQKRMAYKIVLKTHSISKAKDYNAALQENYSYESMKHEVKNMMYMMRPEHVREKRARILINEQQRRMDEVVKKNKENLDRLFPPPKKWVPFGTVEEPKVETPEPVETPLPNIERRNRQSIITLRRRIISIDDPKPVIVKALSLNNINSASPTRTPSLTNRKPLSPIKTPTLTKQPSSHSLSSPRKQAMTMSMMKKQKSFLEAKEKSNVLEHTIEETKDTLVGDPITENHGESAGFVTDNVESDNEAGNSHGNKTDTQKYKVLPPITKPSSTPNGDNKRRSSGQESQPVKLPVLKLNKRVSS